MAADIKCPKENCDKKFPRSNNCKADLQHHLYMSHRIDAIESHKLADQIIAEASKKK